jgi:hypothetical protein
LETYKESKAVYRKLKKLPSSLYSEYTNGIDVLDDISDFFGIEKESDIFEQANRTAALYRTGFFDPDSLNLFAWMRRGELDFLKLDLPEYSRSAFESWIEKDEWRNHLTDEEYFKRLPEIFKSYGAGLVFTPYLEKTIYGAVRWFNGKPLIQISDKDKSLAVCWHILFHEIGHVLLHENDTIFEGEIVSKSNATNKEREANFYAYNKLFKGDGLRKHIFGH